MQSPAAAFEALPSELLTMIYRNIDSIFDLQNMMLASPHVWRHLAIERQIPSILDDLLKEEDSVHPQLAFAIRIAAHLRCESQFLTKLLSKLGLRAFTPGLIRGLWVSDPGENKTLPRDMKPSEVRGLLTTSSAIEATTLQCVSHHLRRFHSLRPAIVNAGDGNNFDLYENEYTGLPTGPRSPVPNTGPLLWRERQQALKAFWMVYIARVFFANYRQRPFEIPERFKDMEVDDMRPVDLFGFERQGHLYWNDRNRPRDYLFHAMQLFLTAEEYLEDVTLKPGDDWPLTLGILPCEGSIRDTEAWPAVSETMEHFVRLFKEIRSLRDGDGFHPWRRLGFAIWDIERLRTAGLVHHPRRDRDDDRVRWLSVIREEDFGSVRSHRLVVPEVLKGVGDVEGEDYTYAEDSDESSMEMHWSSSFWLPEEDSYRKSLALEFGRQGRDAA